MASKNETPLVRAILEALKMRGVNAWRNNSGVTIVGGGPSRRVIRGGPAGSPDIFGSFPVELNGCRFAVLFGIEVKTTTGRQLASQRRYQLNFEADGGRYGIARGVGEALKLVASWQLEAGKRERVT